MKFSVQTATLPELSIPEVVTKLCAHGYDGVEWRLHDDYHIKPTEVIDQAKRIKPLLDYHGLAVSCLMGYAPLRDLDQHKRVTEACAILGCPRFRPGAVLYDGTSNYHDIYQAAIDDIGKLLDAIAGCDIKPVIETHFGTIAPSPALARRLVEHFDPHRIGVNFDPANMIIEGRESWQLGLELLGPYLDYVHAKNISWVREDDRWRWQFASLEDGQVDWRELVAALQRVGYDGYISFENFFQVPMRSRGFVGEDLTYRASSYRNIEERLTKDLDYMRCCLTKRPPG
jgi:sugar phosphate isomerase/epimerase